MTAGTKLGINGAGGLGSVAIQFAVGVGAADDEINQDVWTSATAYGATQVD